MFDWLIKQRQIGIDKFFSVNDVTKGLKSEGVMIPNVRYACMRLLEFGFLDVTSYWPRKFRVKLCVVKRHKRLKSNGFNV